MNNYNNLKVLRSDEIARKRPELYFLDGQPNPDTISIQIAQGALALGAKDVHVAKIRGWH